MATKIMVKMLVENSACKKDVKRFRRKYPKGVYVTVNNVTAALLIFIVDSFDWVVDNFLSAKQGKRFRDDTNYITTGQMLVPKEKHKQFACAFVKAWNTGRKKQRRK